MHILIPINIEKSCDIRDVEPCPDRGQLTKSVKWWIGGRFNLSRGANPCYRDISIIGGEGDIRGWPVFQTDNRRYAVAGR